jgi:hypothetical protein
LEARKKSLKGGWLNIANKKNTERIRDGNESEIDDGKRRKKSGEIKWERSTVCG